MTKKRKTKDEKNKMVRFTRKVVQHSTGRWHQNVKKNNNENIMGKEGI